MKKNWNDKKLKWKKVSNENFFKLKIKFIKDKKKKKNHYKKKNPKKEIYNKFGGFENIIIVMFNIKFLYQVRDKVIADMKEEILNECGICQNKMDHLQ